jgi:hypothetical protein
MLLGFANLLIIVLVVLASLLAYGPKQAAVAIFMVLFFSTLIRMKLIEK